MEISLIRSVSSKAGKLVQLTNQGVRVGPRALQTTSIDYQTKIPDQKSQLRASVQRLHTPAEQLRYSSVRPNLKPQPLEYPDESEEPSYRYRESTTALQTETEVQVPRPEVSSRPLAVVIAWLGAKPKHVEKYKKIWSDRGFDVISESINATDLLFPKQRAIPRVNRLLHTLYELTASGRNQEVVMHCFSVGGYIFGEMVHQLMNEQTRKEIQGNKDIDPREVLQKSIKGIIFDSLVNLDGISYGVSRSITGNPMLASVIRRSIDLHLLLSHNYAGKYYLQSSHCAHSNPLFHVPSMFMISDADYIGTPAMTEKLSGMWKEQGIPVELKYFDNSEHVRHYTQYPELYLSEVDRFLSKLKLDAFESERAKEIG